MRARSARCGAAVLLAVAATAFAQPAPLPPGRAGRAAPPRAAVAHPLKAGFDLDRIAAVDSLIEAAIRNKLLPGAVVLVGRGDTIVYQRAYGQRAVVPAPEPMTLDTIFDLASLTKVVATTTSVMQLVEQGRIRLNDKVATFIPGFGRYGKGEVTIRHLMTHYSGLRPDLDLEDAFRGSDEAIARAAEEVLVAPPGTAFLYSDINFFLLGEIVKRVSGERLDVYARGHVFDPVGMRDTGFLPAASLRSRIAPTEACDPVAWPCSTPGAPMLRGIVHDPTSRRMGGVAGHAGLFSTVSDLAIFCRMLLGGGAVNGTRVLAPLTVAKMTSPATPRGARNVRGLGWDIDTSFSVNRGDLLPIGSFGHTGFTGNSIWIDPATGVYLIFLSNRVHPDGTGDVTPLRGQVATAVAAALVDPGPLRPPVPQMSGADFSAGAISATPARIGPVRNGIDVLAARQFAPLKGKRVALLTNQAARSATGAFTIDVLREGLGPGLVVLFSPEHGLRGDRDEKVASGRDERTGLPVHSLYGDTERPTPAMLRDLDVLVIDLPDIGARFYTFMTTMAWAMEEAGRRKLPVMVLDRPNPIGGVAIEGPAADAATLGSPITYFPGMPVRHGMTVGELARLFNEENHLGVDLTVIAMEGWQRDAWFEATGLPWANPSPNMRNLLQATLYPGVGAIEYSNVSVGRGTDSPFEQIGAPWIDGVALAGVLNGRALPGIRFYPVSFTPAASGYAGERCGGVFMMVTNREVLRPVRAGLEIAAALKRLYPDEYDFKTTARLLGSAGSLARVAAGEDPATVAESWVSDEARWRRVRAKYLMYR